MEKVNLVEKFKLFNEYWAPRIVGELNGQYVKLAKFKGEFMWHSHANEDELFMVVKGTLKIEFRDKTVTLKEGELYIVPKGIEHKPVADEEVHVLLLEPKSTEQTGGIESDLLVDKQPWI
ncbi:MULTISPECIES: cupin domain-containing protein [Legionella]|uniref:Cupin domain-containing protein n=1 Tax=Legionella resiliens TaxID=2905958 RepID=A0ABS8X8P6_9GAMM|nr:MULTISPECIES: cupin domain-containing protein [unclassified Legionella]MCE0724882.1 cupin domain-containing protein [Legionella sp. 9fVS26]MCE3534036.1 cupin domain-containing protein [Legionella sp. 8cVS16]QLZ70270.1 cupin domain-containing protein [Legionella sp. PC1000]